MSIKKRIEGLIDQDAAIKKDLLRGLINIRALARYFQKKMNNVPSLESVINIIRRYDISENDYDLMNKAHDILSTGKISMKTNITSITLMNTFDVHEVIANITSFLDPSLGNTIRFVSGMAIIKFIIDEDKLEKVLTLLPEKRIISINKKNSEILLSFDYKVEKTPGVAAMMANELALNNINIIELMSCIPEFIILVNEDDGIKAFRVLQDLIKNR